MRVAVLFIDGVGIGVRDTAINPLARGEFLLSAFDDGSETPLPDGGLRYRVDATFGLAGRPQSASNQTAIYTGRTAPVEVGGHVAGFPNAALRSLLLAHSVAREASDCAYLNAFPAAYLSLLGLRTTSEPADAVPPRVARKARAAAGQLAMQAGGATFFTFEEAHRGLALTHDIDGSLASLRGLSVPRRTRSEAAEIFWAGARHLTLFEHFLADEAGHLQDMDLALRAVSTFDSFLRAVLERRPADTAVVVCSDHGNVEDLRSRNHTNHPVNVLTFGLPRVAALTNVAEVGQLIRALLSSP